MEPTRVSLLVRLKSEPNEIDWQDFYTTYSGVIQGYSQKRGCSPEEAMDVLQETMVDLMKILPTFEYNRSKGLFRNFLLTIVHRRAIKVQNRKIRRSETSLDQPIGDGSRSLLDLMPSQETWSVGEDEERAWQEAIFEQAWENLRKDPSIKGNTLDVFEAYVIKSNSASEVADQFGMSENAIYQIRNRLMKKLQQEVALLKPENV